MPPLPTEADVRTTARKRLHGADLLAAALLAAVIGACVVLCLVAMQSDRTRQLAAAEHVTAVLLTDAAPLDRTVAGIADVRFTVADGSSHTMRVDVPDAHLMAGQTVRLWVTHRGALTDAPMGAVSGVVQGVLMGLSGGAMIILFLGILTAGGESLFSRLRRRGALATT